MTPTNILKGFHSLTLRQQTHLLVLLNASHEQKKDEASKQLHKIYSLNKETT